MKPLLFFFLLAAEIAAAVPWASMPLKRPVATGSGGFTPVSGYLVWWNPDTVTSPVSTWTDETGNYTATQPTSAYQPPLTQVNGHNMLAPSGTQFLTSPFSSAAQPLEFFVVVSNGNSSFGSVPVVCGTETAQNFAVLYGDPGGGGDISTYAGTALNSSVDFGGGGLPAVVCTVILNGSSSSVWTNGVEISSGSAGSSGNNGTFEIGGYDFAQFWTGGIGDILGYTSVLSTANQHANEKGLCSKFGIPYQGP